VRLFEAEQQRTADLAESLEQQTATSEVLRVISSSPGELEPVFQAMLENATRICEAKFGTMYFRESDGFRAVAMHGAPPAYVESRLHKLVHPGPATGIGRVLQTKQAVQIEDASTDQGYSERDPMRVSAVELGGVRTLLDVPMLKENEVIGAVAIYREVVRPFTDKQVALVQNFANQAVIAIENTRLLNELRQSLEQQTATADVLRVISSSPGQLEPVFQAMLENAVRICEAKFGTLYRFDGEMYQMAASVGTPPEFDEFQRRRGPFRPTPGIILDQIMRTKQMSHCADVAAEPVNAATARLGGARSIVGVPMLKDDLLIGAIVIYRREVRPFNEKQITLLTNFAAQAVIAIENTRLINELRQRTNDLTESLEQQTATSEVLRVISSSPGELDPVFQTMLANAVRICDAKFGVMYRSDKETFDPVALFGTPPALAEFLQQRGAFRPDAGTGLDHLLRTKDVVRIVDESTGPAFRAAAKFGGARSLVAVPMLKEGELIGVIIIYRQEVRPFTDKQVELVQNFAAQAVIAIENTRLLTELRQRTTDLTESLETLRTAQDRLVQTEKLASLGQLTAGIAHEIKNPLNFVNNFSSVSVELIDELKEVLVGVKADDKSRTEMTDLMETLRNNLDKIVQHGKRADAIVKNMLLHSRQGSGEHRPVDINALVEESLNLAYHGARAEKQGFEITLERSFDAAAGEADVFPQEITRALLNLISNGFYAATKRKTEANGGNYEPTLAAATKNLGDSVEIRIRDNGMGMPLEVKEKLFNPFFTTKPAGEGTGLGLSISHDIIVKQHGGSIEVDTKPGEFTEFRIVLPRAGMALTKPGERASH
jgi:two-component system, NtrC family, sensor kinase